MLVVGKEEGSGQGRCAQDFLLHRYVKEDGINRSPSALFVVVYAFAGKCFVRDTNKLQPQPWHHRCQLLLLLLLFLLSSISQQYILVFFP